MLEWRKHLEDGMPPFAVAGPAGKEWKGDNHRARQF